MDFDKPKVYGDTSITDGLVFVKYGKTRQSNQCGFCIYLLDDWSGLVWKVNQDDLDSEYEGFDGFTEDSSMNGLFGNYAFIYIFKNCDMSRLSTDASGKKSNNLLGKNLQKEAKKNKSVLQKCKKKNILFELLLFLSLPS